MFSHAMRDRQFVHNIHTRAQTHIHTNYSVSYTHTHTAHTLAPISLHSDGALSLFTCTMRKYAFISPPALPFAVWPPPLSGREHARTATYPFQSRSRHVGLSDRK